MNKAAPSRAVLRALLQTKGESDSVEHECVVRHFASGSRTASWAVNPTSKDCEITVRAPSAPAVLRGRLLNYDAGASSAKLSVPARDAAVLLFETR